MISILNLKDLSVILLVALYGAENWLVMKETEHRLSTMEIKMLVLDQ